jgi:hypothetical protein
MSRSLPDAPSVIVTSLPGVEAHLNPSIESGRIAGIKIGINWSLLVVLCASRVVIRGRRVPVAESGLLRWDVHRDAGSSIETPPEELDAAIIFAAVAELAGELRGATV